jgi:hypothetical protein
MIFAPLFRLKFVFSSQLATRQRQRDGEPMSWVHTLLLPDGLEIGWFHYKSSVKIAPPSGARPLTKSLFNPVVMLRSHAPGNL